MQYLLDSKKEYIDIILDNITSPICNSIYDMYKSSKNVQEFQSKMANIKNWNNYNINEYYLSILKLSKIKNLGQILNQIIILNVQLKTEKKNVNPNSIKFITIEDFIYKCLVNASIYCWKNAYLFAHKNLRPSEKQYHLNIIEKNIKKTIKSTIRDCTPFDIILDNITYLSDLDPIRKPDDSNNDKLNKILLDTENLDEESEEESDEDEGSDEEEEEDEVEIEEDDESEEEVEEELKQTKEIKKEPVIVSESESEEKREIYIASDNESVPKKKKCSKKTESSSEEESPVSEEETDETNEIQIESEDLSADDSESLKSVNLQKVHPVVASDSDDVSVKSEVLKIKSPVPAKRQELPKTPKAPKKEKSNKKPILNANLTDSKKKLVFASNSSSEDEEKTKFTNKLYKSDNSDDDNEETHFNNDVKTIKINSSSKSRYYS
jgi:hypothetical protein